MLTLIDRILEHVPSDFVSDAELVALLPGSPASRHNKISRALAKKELLLIRRGLYLLPPRYQRRGIHAAELAERIYGPSYVSFESALSFHGLIPEAAYMVTSASVKRARRFKTPLGTFTYTPTPLRAFPVSCERIKKDSHIFLMATPLKALADYVYANKLDWLGVEPLTESLRIDPTDLSFTKEEIIEIKNAYHSKRVTLFLEGLRKDLKL
jgi:predicted transcriptional regulator of viral defense system